MSGFSRTKNSVINIITGAGGQTFTLFLRFVTRTVFIHTLGKEYLGIDGLFSNILTMLTLTELGFDTALNFKLYKPLAERDDKRVRIILVFYRQIYSIIGVVIFALGILVIPLLPVLIKDYDSLAYLGINAVVLFLLYLLQTVSTYLFFAYRRAILKADQKNYIIDVVDLAVAVVSNIVQILILLFSGSFIVYTIVVLAFYIVKNLISSVIAKKIYPQLFSPEEERLSKNEIAGLFKDCMALFGFRTNYVILKATDNIVLSSFIGLGIVGIYSNYLLIYNTISNFLRKIYDSVKASLGNYFATETIEKQYSMFKTLNFITTLSYGTAAVGVAVCADELIRCWLGSDFVVGHYFSVLVAVELLLSGYKRNLEQVRDLSGIFRQMWYRPIISVIVNIFSSILLVKIYGIHGVIMGTIISDLASSFAIDPRVITRYSFQNIYSSGEYYFNTVRYIATLAIIGMVVRRICFLVLPNFGVISVVIHIAIVSIVVPLSLVLLYWKTNECKYLMTVAKRILKKAF